MNFDANVMTIEKEWGLSFRHCQFLVIGGSDSACNYCSLHNDQTACIIFEVELEKVRARPINVFYLNSGSVIKR